MAIQTVPIIWAGTADPSGRAFTSAPGFTWGSIGFAYLPDTNAANPVPSEGYRGWVPDLAAMGVCAGAALTEMTIDVPVSGAADVDDDALTNATTSTGEIPATARGYGAPINPATGLTPGEETCVGQESAASPPGAALSFPGPVTMNTTYDLSGLSDTDGPDIMVTVLSAPESTLLMDVGPPSGTLSYDDAACAPVEPPAVETREGVYAIAKLRQCDLDYLAGQIGAGASAADIAAANIAAARNVTPRVHTFTDTGGVESLPVAPGARGEIMGVSDVGAGFVRWTIDGTNPPTTAVTGDYAHTTGPYHAGFGLKNVPLDLVRFDGTQAGSDYTVYWVEYP